MKGQGSMASVQLRRKGLADTLHVFDSVEHYKSEQKHSSEIYRVCQ
jgi:hypothetical protein